MERDERKEGGKDEGREGWREGGREEMGRMDKNCGKRKRESERREGEKEMNISEMLDTISLLGKLAKIGAVGEMSSP